MHHSTGDTDKNHETLQSE